MCTILTIIEIMCRVSTWEKQNEPINQANDVALASTVSYPDQQRYWLAVVAGAELN